MHGLFDGFSRQATISCYMCVFHIFDAICMGFLNGFADRSALVGICAVLFDFLVFFYATCIGFSIGFADRPPLVFFVLLPYVFELVCMGFLSALADRPSDNLNNTSQPVISTTRFQQNLNN